MLSSYKNIIDSHVSRMLAGRARWSILVAVVVLATIGGCMTSMLPPGHLDYARIRVSEGGLYRAEIKPDGDSIPQGKLQQWTLHVEGANGAPVTSAAVAIDGGMPQHGHGLPTKPRMTKELGNGDYLIEGMKFNMGGWWVVKFRVTSPAGVDSLVFNLKL